MNTVKKPILLDETGKEMVRAMHTQNALLSTIARDSVKAYESWKDIQAVVRRGLAKEIFYIGDQFIVPWKDVAADKTYDVPLDVVHFGDVELESGEIVPAMFLQWHYTIPFGVQFDAPENEVASDNFSADYSYYRKESSGKYKLLTEGTDYKIGDAIPTDATYCRSAIKDPTGSICLYGYNRWSHSAIRQFLNSKGGKGNWWVKQHLGDVSPVQLTSKAGFMTGFEDDFLSAIGPIKVSTLLNTVTDKPSMIEDTYDTFFLPSLEQIYVQSELPLSAEGDYFEYWKRATNSTSPNERKSKNSGYLTYGIGAKTTLQAVRLRSAARSYSYDTWTVFASGYIDITHAYTAHPCAPVCAIY